MPSVKDDRQVPYRMLAPVQQTFDDLRRSQTAISLIGLRQTLQRLFVGHLRQQNCAHRVLGVLENSLRVVWQARLVKTHHISHQTNEDEVGGPNGRLPYAHHASIVRGIEVAELMKATAGEERLSGAGRILAFERLPQERAEVEIRLAPERGRCPFTERIARQVRTTRQRRGIER